MISKKELENKFSRHIGRILSKFDNISEKSVNEMQELSELYDMKDFTKGEMWLLCKDLIIMLGMNEENKNDKNYNR